MEIPENIVRRIEGEYVEIRYFSMTYRDLKTRLGKVEETDKEGISVRVVDKGRLKVAFSTAPEQLEDRVQSAPWIPVSAYTPCDPLQYAGKTPEPLKLPVEKVKNVLESLKGLESAEARLESIAVHEHILTNGGTDVRHGNSKMLVRFFLKPAKGSTHVYSFGYPGDSDIDSDVLELLKGRDLKTSNCHVLSPGTYDVVLSPQVTGMLFHEIAHAFEGSLPEIPFLSTITMIENPCAERLGGYIYDSEGCKSSQTYLIDKGTVQGCLASVFEPGTVYPTGNGRASSFDVQPMPRQSNLEVYSQEEQLTEEELLEAVTTGVYIAQVGEGSTFPGNITYFDNAVAYRIEKGECTEPLRGISFGGNPLTMAAKIENMGKNQKVEPAVCWKNKQRLFITTKAPSSLMRGVSLTSCTARTV